MPNSYRIRTQIGVDKSVTVNLDQDFDQLEILSLKITQSEVYTRACSDYGVVVGRVIVNDGYGLPNAKVSIFIPLSDEDELDPIISTLYPYKTPSDINEEGYRYNLLPYIQSYSNHTPTGTFPDRQDVLLNKSLVEVYDKYYKFTVKTNDSGDFMIFGVPVGPQLLFMDLDLSDIGEFSLTPQDMVRLGLASEGQMNGLKFRASTNLYSLPQIVSMSSQIDVMPLWGDPQICQLSITRNDFDLAELGISLQPSAIFMGSLISTPDRYAVRKYNYGRNLCKLKIKTGELCKLITGPGEIVSIRQTILNDNLGRPILEQYQLDGAGKVIDENGAWLVDLPMNMDFVYTDEFGNQVISNDPEVGVPTTAKYRFKIKWEQPTNQNNVNQRGYFLVPNIKEWWGISTDPNIFNKNIGLQAPTPANANEQLALEANYAFSLDWEDYGHPTNNIIKTQQINEAISCDDRFYKFHYNKVYTVSQFIDQYRGGRGARKINSIKNILDDSCEDNVNQFPANDAQFQGDLIYLLFTIFLRIMTPVFLVVLILQHVLAFLLYVLRPIIYFLAFVIGYLVYAICKLLNRFKKLFGGKTNDCGNKNEIRQRAKELADLYKKFKNFPLANLTYPDCEMCNCKSENANYDKVDPYADQVTSILSQVNISLLSDWNSSDFYDTMSDWVIETNGFGVDWWGTSDWSDFITSVMSGAPVGYNPNDYTKDFTTVINGELQRFQYRKSLASGCGNDKSDRFHDRVRKYFSPSLTTAERLNLFNTKGKYFNSGALGGVPNDGGTDDFGSGFRSGVNQIKVTFNSPEPINTNKHHLDNVFILSCDEGTEPDFPTGSIVFFNSFDYSKDVNALSASTDNDLGVPCITGSTVIGSTLYSTGEYTFNTTVTWANPNDVNSVNTTSYLVSANTQDTAYHKWPVDIEYFQVITAMTYSSFSSFCNPNEPINSFNRRFLNNKMSIYKQSQATGNVSFGCNGDSFPFCVGGQIYRPFTWSDYDFGAAINDNDQCRAVQVTTSNYLPFLDLSNPVSGASASKDQVIVILVRGVDPYSTRNINTYDLSKIFGYDFGNGPIITGNYKLNIPIQFKLKNAKHNDILTNISISPYSDSTGIYYDTFNYIPGTEYSSFTSNLISYYSSLDASVSSIGPWPGTDKFSYQNTTTGDLRVKGAPIGRINPNPPIPLNNLAGSDGGVVNLPTSQIQGVWYNMMTVDFTRQYYGSNDALQGRLFNNTAAAGIAGNCFSNKFCFEADGNFIPRDNYTMFNLNIPSSKDVNRGYYRNESVEGGSLLCLHINQDGATNNNVTIGNVCYGCACNGSEKYYYNQFAQTNPSGHYYSPSYDKASTTITFLNSNDSEKRRIIMRSDRLPTSTNEYINGCGDPTGIVGEVINFDFVDYVNNLQLPSFGGNSSVYSTYQGILNVVNDNNGFIIVGNQSNGNALFNNFNGPIGGSSNAIIKNNNNFGIYITIKINVTDEFPLNTNINRVRYYIGPVVGTSASNSTLLGEFIPTPGNTYSNTFNLPWYFIQQNTSVCIWVQYRSLTPGILGTLSTVNYRSSKIQPSNGEITIVGIGSGGPYCGNSYALHQNPNFGISIAEDDGTITTEPPVSFGFNNFNNDGIKDEIPSTFANVMDSLSECEKMLPLECYYNVYTGTTDEIQVSPTHVVNNRTCTTFKALGIERPIFQYGNGCYLLVTRPLLSLPLDIRLLLEWKSRLDITFAACRNVFGHLFTNNWINGVLYAYTFRNDILFTSPFKPNGNQPYMNYCWDTVYYHKTTNNFYYRSAPFRNGNFVGKPGKTSIGGNDNYINNPTTITDLGPRASYLSQLTNSNVFFGYNMDNITDTTFRDTSDILNIFILSRIVNANFWNLLFGSNGAGVFGLFSRVPRTVGPNVKQKNFVDADFAQLISINTELGVKGFEGDNIGDGQNPVIVQLGTNAKETIFGVYFDSDREVRDLVTPRRVIYNENTVPPYLNSFEQLPVDTQEVPFYGWKINDNTNRRTIFGTQQNDWDTNSIKSFLYQRQDRLNFAQIDLNQAGFTTFNYMQSINPNSYPSQYLRGHIYAIKTQLPPNDPYVVSNDPNDIFNGLTQTFQVGAPFHFYFGLIKGATAYDKFRIKWIEGEIIT